MRLRARDFTPRSDRRNRQVGGSARATRAPKSGDATLRRPPEVPAIQQPDESAVAEESDLAAQEADFKRRQIQREESEAKNKAASAQRCARLRNEYNLLASSSRLFKFDDKGQRVYVEDASREARVAQLKEQLRTCP